MSCAGWRWVGQVGAAPATRTHMPRQHRIDFPGALHHVMQRGIEGGRLFRDDGDRVNFLRRVGTNFDGANQTCFVWSLMLNHVHLANQTGEQPLARAMHRLGTGYATSFNRRYERKGHLYQNRYKSLLIEDEEYLYEAIRYVLLNPVRSGQLRDLQDLLAYPWTAYPGLMGKQTIVAGDPRFTLRLFDENAANARSRLRDWLLLGMEQEDLIGLIIERGPGRPGRLVGEYSACARIGIRDSGVLGSRQFVTDVMCAAGNPDTSALEVRVSGLSVDALVAEICDGMSVDTRCLAQGRRGSDVSRARAVIAWMSTRYLGATQTDLAPVLGVCQQSVGRSLLRGRQIAEQMDLDLERCLVRRT
jgi:putative transposase